METPFGDPFWTLCSWAGLCPGNEESAGKRKRSRTTQGNRWLRRALCEAARAASRKKDSYFLAQYRRLASRRGANRASLAVAHSLLVVFYHLLSHCEKAYQELGATYFDQLDPQRVRRYLVKRLVSWFIVNWKGGARIVRSQEEIRVPLLCSRNCLSESTLTPLGIEKRNPYWHRPGHMERLL